MGIEYTNRRGETYYLLQGKTKTGKPKYYVSRKPDGIPVEEMPEGYELHEGPERGIVSVRKIRTSKVTSLERAFLQRKVKDLCAVDHFRVEIEGDSLVVYAPEVRPAASAALLNRLFGDFAAGLMEDADSIGNRASYQAMFRFSLEDDNKRLFSVERWCFKGSIDGWFPLGAAKSLEVQADKYLPHLFEESFFELM